MIRQGGRVILSGNRPTLRSLRDLPAGDLTVTGVDLTGTLIEPKDLERIGALPHLHELYLPGPSFNPASGSRLDANDQLKYLAGLKELERLDHARKYPDAKLEGAVVVTSSQSGDVIAIVGSRNVGYDGFNRALDARRQIG